MQRDLVLCALIWYFQALRYAHPNCRLGALKTPERSEAGGSMARVHYQAAVIPYRIRKERVEVALVTTSTGKGWIVPKGTVDDGERPRDTAIREAEEEAGLRGVVARRPVGRYTHSKGSNLRRVDVYMMRVTSVREHWLE